MPPRLFGITDHHFPHYCDQFSFLQFSIGLRFGDRWATPLFHFIPLEPGFYNFCRMLRVVVPLEDLLKWHFPFSMWQHYRFHNVSVHLSIHGTINTMKWPQTKSRKAYPDLNIATMFDYIQTIRIFKTCVSWASNVTHAITSYQIKFGLITEKNNFSPYQTFYMIFSELQSS